MDFVDGGTQTPPGDERFEELEDIRHTAIEIANDVIYYTAGHNGMVHHQPSRYALTMRGLVLEILKKYNQTFQNLLKRIDIDQITSDQGPVTFSTVMDDVFSDDCISWGRIAVVYAFGCRIAEECRKPVVTRKISQLVGDYVSDKLSIWIASHGGWDGFDEYFQKHNIQDDRIWKGFLWTLGAGVVGVAAYAFVSLR